MREHVGQAGRNPEKQRRHYAVWIPPAVCGTGMTKKRYFVIQGNYVMRKKITPHDDAYARRFILMSLGAVGIFVIFLFIVIPLLFNADGGATDVKKDIYLKTLKLNAQG